MDECLNRYRRVSKEYIDEHQERLNTDGCLNQYRWVSKEDTYEYQQSLNTNECLNQYERVLKEDTNENYKVKHRRVFELIQTGIERRYERGSRKVK